MHTFRFLAVRLCVLACCLGAPASAKDDPRPQVVILGASRQAGVAAAIQKLDRRVIVHETSGLDLPGVWKLLGKASGALLLVDAIDGPTRESRDHLLLARQAGFDRLPIVLWHVNELLAFDEKRELFDMEVHETLELERRYGFEVEKAEVRSDVATQGVQRLAREDIAALLELPQARPSGSPWTTATVSGVVYVLSKPEAAGATTLGPAAKVELLIDGKVVKATIAAGQLAPGETGLLKFGVAARAVRVVTRFAVLHERALVAVGLVAPDDYVFEAPDSEKSSQSPEVRQREAQAAYGQATTLYEAGKYAEALAQIERALVLWDALVGSAHPEVAKCLNMLGIVHHTLGDLGRAEPPLQRALALREEALGRNHPDVAESLLNLGNLYWRRGSYGQAEPLLKRALAIWEAALGKHHPQVTSPLTTLAIIYQDQGVYGQAEPLLERTLAIREAALGKHHTDVAAALTNLAILYWKQGLYARATPLAERAIAIQEAALGKHHPTVARTLANLANLYQDQGLYGQAEPLLERAIAIKEAAFGKHHPELANSLNSLAALYQRQGRYSQATPLLERTIAIFEAALGKHHPHVAASLNNLAIVFQEQGLYGQAEPLMDRALAIREATLGKSHPDVANSLNNLANLYQHQGLYSRATPLQERALAIQEAALGKHHPHVAASLNNLARLYFHQGMNDQAEPLLERALGIWEAGLGRHHPDVANSLNNLADLYSQQGMNDRAEPLFKRALAIQEAALGKHHPDVSHSLLNLATLYSGQGMYGRAEPLFERALAIREAALGKHHPHVGQSLYKLGLLYFQQGMLSRAEPLFKRALAIQEAALGKHHADLSNTLSDLGLLYFQQGLKDRAEPLFERALAMREATRSKHHVDVVKSLHNLAILRLTQHRLDAAVDLLTRAIAVTEQRLRQETLGFSEARLASLLQIVRPYEELLYALPRGFPDNARMRRLALSAALLRKGRSAEETAHISRAVYRSLGPEDHGTLERLRGLRTQLAQLSHQGPGALSPGAYQQQLKQLAEQGDALEATLARRSAPLRALATLPSPADIVDRVAQALPKDGALVELVAYQGRVTEAPRGQSGLRYLALVLWPDATLRALDLGPAEPIDLAASRLRDALANRDASFESHAQALYRLAFQPLLPLLGERRRLFLSPDGQLALVPFAALHDGRQFLVESFDFTYLTSGKDLLPRPQDSVPSTSVFVLADPDFKAPRQAAPAAPKRSPSPKRHSSALRQGLATASWASLPGSRAEAQSIQRLFPHARLFLGPEATKERLLGVARPGVLHLATHGFFREDAPVPSASRAIAQFGGGGGDAPSARVPDPLLRSGLVLANAPQPQAALVTALELAGLNLWGTQLVVLSACDTGRGDVKLGQGIYGLRRAFVVAGAETVVMSLWKVNDQTTQTLMEAYYRNLLQGQGRATALRAAMRALRLTHEHPHYWAPFIAAGSDAPLRGS